MKRFIYLTTLLLAILFTFIACEDLARPEPESYRVTFNANGGSPVDFQIIVKGNKLLSPDPPQFLGHEFDGWYVDVSLTSKWDFDNGIVSADMTLYAKWVSISQTSYTVSFDLKDGTDPSLQAVLEGEKATQPLDPIKEGFTFLGWFVDRGGEEELWDFDTKINSDVFLFAKWESITISVGGISLDSSTMFLDIHSTTGQLNATIVPVNANNQNITWTSSDPSIAMVDSLGFVTAVSPGYVTITAVTEDGDFSAACEVSSLRPDYLITKWQVAAGQTLNIPLDPSPMITNEVINWGDGNVERTQGSNRSHTYINGGTYTVIISEGVKYFGFDEEALESDRLSLLDISHWGGTRLGNLHTGAQFMGCRNLEGFSAMDTPDMSQVRSLKATFLDARKFEADLSNWDVSNVTDMSDMFWCATSFNGDLSSWDVSNVTDMSDMFWYATSFNRDLSSWDVSNVTDMSRMFCQATSFNRDLSTWNVSNVIDMSDMFWKATSFNGDLSTWNVSNVTNMSYMFTDATSFNGDLSTWNVSNVTNMICMFCEAASFNGDISGWNVSSVTTMSSMFAKANSFNQDISRWNTSSVSFMDGLFRDAISFNQDLSGWNVSSVKYMWKMFYGAKSFDQNLNNWDTSSVRVWSNMFVGSPLEQSPPTWWNPVDPDPDPYDPYIP